MRNFNHNNIVVHYAKILLVAVVLLVATPVHRVEALSIAVRISDQSTDVASGDRLYFEVEIKYPENARRKDLRVEYQVLEDGEVIASEKVLRAVETQASFLDYVVVPQDAKVGKHDINVVVSDYEDLQKEVSASFNIIKGSDRLLIYFLILLLSVALVGLLVTLQIRAVSRGRRQLN